MECTDIMSNFTLDININIHTFNQQKQLKEMRLFIEVVKVLFN